MSACPLIAQDRESHPHCGCPHCLLGRLKGIREQVQDLILPAAALPNEPVQPSVASYGKESPKSLSRALHAVTPQSTLNPQFPGLSLFSHAWWGGNLGTPGTAWRCRENTLSSNSSARLSSAPSMGVQPRWIPTRSSPSRSGMKVAR